jgi:hypothetical protein
MIPLLDEVVRFNVAATLTDYCIILYYLIHCVRKEKMPPILA